MSTTPPLALSNIVDITVTVAPPAPLVPSFNQGLIIGSSPVIPSYGSNARVRQYASTTAMLTDGFSSSDPEFIAAQIYFSQIPPAQFVWIGRQDLTAIESAVPSGRTVTDAAMSSITNPTFLDSATADFISGDIGSQVIVAGAGVAGADLITTIASVTSTTVAVLTAAASTTVSGAKLQLGAYGENYKVGDTVLVVQSSASNGLLKVLTIGTDGQVLTLGTTISNQGTGYSDANGLTTTGGSGSGLKVNITGVGETLLQASQACRLANATWYGLMVCNPVDADNLAIASWADALWQNTRYYAWSNDTAIPDGTADNLFLQLQALNLRVLAIYSTTQGGGFPNNIYAAAGMMGVDMGLNTGLANSFFTLAHKQIAGISVEPLSQTQYTNIINASGNVVGNFAPYNVIEAGFMSNGAPSFLWMYLAMLVANMQFDVMDVLTSLPAVPQTNAGEHLLIQACNQACAFMASIGFLAAGIWTGAPIPIPSANNPSLQTGDALNLGYLNVAAPYSQQSAGDRAAGKAMPIYCAITTAGAVQSLLIGVLTQL